MSRSIPAITVYPLLLRHQLRKAFRAVTAPGSRMVTIVMAFMGTYIGFTLFVLGLYFPMFSSQFSPGSDPVGLVNEHALSVMFGLFAFRFLFQKTPRIQLQPYLHLPMRRSGLVAFFLLATLWSVHNLLPLLFVVPFSLRQIAPLYGTAAAVSWAGGAVALLLVSNFANLYLRTLLNQRERIFLTVIGAFLLIGLADEYLGTQVVRTISTGIFGVLLLADPWTALSFAMFVVGTGLFAGITMLRSVRAATSPVTHAHRSGRLHELAERWDVSGHLVWLELRLMWRNRRPRHYLLVSLLFSTVYLVALLASPALFGDFIFAAVIGLFASGGFALNYGQLMFGWDSGYFDGLLARSLKTRLLARTKVFVLQGSCLALFVLSLPLFLWLRPDLVPLHVAFLFYNAGVTSQLVMELAIRNRDHVDLSRSGGFFNYEGFSARHWLWFIPTALPPTLLLMAFRHRPELGWTVLALVGLASLAVTELWVRRHASIIDLTKYRMAAGFRHQA